MGRFNSLNTNMFQQIQEIAKVGAWELDLNTGLTSWSEEVYRIHGVPVGTEVPKDEAINFYAPEDRPRIIRALEISIDEQKTVDDVYRFIDAKGVVKRVRSIVHPMMNEDGSVDKLFGIFQDVSEQHEREQENRYILEVTKMGVWKWDIVENFLEWDDGLYDIYGVNKEDFSAAFDAWESTIHPDHKAQAEADLAKALEETGELDTTFTILKKDGSTAYIGARGRVFYNQNKVPVKMLGINWDKTKDIEIQKKMDNQKRLANESAKFASLGQLSAGMGHEINNPLAIIRSHIELIQKDLKNDIDIPVDDLKNRFRKVEIAIGRIEKIVKGLRTFSRRDQDMKDYFIVSEAINESIDLVEEIYKKDGVAIERLGEGYNEDLSLYGCRGHFQQIFMNLIGNAKDALEKVEGEKIIKISLERDQDFLDMRVKNTGPLIPEAIRNAMFDPFYTTKEVGKGTGIGLTISKNHTEEFGGTLTVADEELTSFQVRIPISDVKKQNDPSTKTA